MDARIARTRGASRERRTGGWAGQAVEPLEDRAAPVGWHGIDGGVWVVRLAGGRDVGRSRGAVGAGFSEVGTLGLGGGMSNPVLLLTAPLLEGGSGTTAPPSPAVFSNSAVQSAMQTLQTDLKTDMPSGAKPTHASVGALEDTLDAIRKGTLTGSAATTQIASDQAAILTSMGLTSAQVTQIQSDQTALQTAITSGEHQYECEHVGNDFKSVRRRTTSTSTGPSSAVQTAMQTLQTCDSKRHAEQPDDQPRGGRASGG